MCFCVDECVCSGCGGIMGGGKKVRRCEEIKKQKKIKVHNIKVDVWLHGIASLCVSFCNSASYVNRSVIRNSKRMPSRGRPLSLSPVLHTARIMHCIKYLLVFVRRMLHFLQRNNHHKRARVFAWACVFKAQMTLVPAATLLRIHIPLDLTQSVPLVFACLISHVLRHANTCIHTY